MWIVYLWYELPGWEGPILLQVNQEGSVPNLAINQKQIQACTGYGYVLSLGTHGQLSWKPSFSFCNKWSFLRWYHLMNTRPHPNYYMYIFTITVYGLHSLHSIYSLVCICSPLIRCCSAMALSREMHLPLPNSLHMARLPQQMQHFENMRLLNPFGISVS